MDEPLLHLEDVWAGYEDRVVLRKISLAVHKGLVALILGPNGHGKTTLLRCISGLIRPTTGTIHLDGTLLNQRSPEQIVKLGIVHVPQGDMLFSGMSVQDNLLIGAFLSSNNAERNSRLEKIYVLLPKLKERREQAAGSLSGGERRMLAIGRGLMTEGQVMLLDEPSLGLAPIVIDQVYDLIHNLKAQGRTIVLVEESPKLAFELADIVFLLEDGRFIWNGPPDELADRQEILEVYLGRRW